MILGCGGLALSDDERMFYRAERPWGFILFARNIAEPNQIADLVADLRDCIGVADAPVLIDQEGGRVQRIRPPIVPDYPPAAVLGEVFDRDEEAGLRAAWLAGRLHAHDLFRFGINVNCVPVLDVPAADGHDVIGKRAYSKDPRAVALLGRQTIIGSMAGGVLPVIKHMPGHGRARSDSHMELPKVDAPLDILRITDFVPFKALADAPMAMTAHLVYSAIDPSGPATTSRTVISDIIRGDIGFDGLLMSDDISMKALSGDFAERAGAIFDAGCDVVLHCNGVMREMIDVAAQTPLLSGKAEGRAKAVTALFGKNAGCDEAALRREFDDLAAQRV